MCHQFRRVVTHPVLEDQGAQVASGAGHEDDQFAGRHLDAAGHPEGTQVAQEAADIILTDDNFATILNAIREGRMVYQNLRKLIAYLITNNIGKIIAIIVMPLCGLPIPLTPVQLLWSNVISESMPSVAICVDTAEDEVMSRRPARMIDPLISSTERFALIVQGVVLSIAIMGGYYVSVRISGSESIGLTATFMITLLSPQLYIFAIRDGNITQRLLRPNFLLKSFFFLSLILMAIIVYVPVANVIFHTKPIWDMRIWGVIVIGSAILPLARFLSGFVSIHQVKAP